MTAKNLPMSGEPTETPEEALYRSFASMDPSRYDGGFDDPLDERHCLIAEATARNPEALQFWEDDGGISVIDATCRAYGVPVEFVEKIYKDTEYIDELADALILARDVLGVDEREMQWEST